MDQPFLEWVVGQAGIGGLAAMALYLLNKAHNDALRREQEYSASNREDKQQMMAVLSENARVLSGLQAAIEGFTRDRH